MAESSEIPSMSVLRLLVMRSRRIASVEVTKLELDEQVFSNRRPSGQPRWLFDRLPCSLAQVRSTLPTSRWSWSSPSSLRSEETLPQTGGSMLMKRRERMGGKKEGFRLTSLTFTRGSQRHRFMKSVCLVDNRLSESECKIYSLIAKWHSPLTAWEVPGGEVMASIANNDDHVVSPASCGHSRGDLSQRVPFLISKPCHLNSFDVATLCR